MTDLTIVCPFTGTTTANPSLNELMAAAWFTSSELLREDGSCRQGR